VIGKDGADAAVAIQYVTTITGDFNWLDDDANGCTTADVTRGAGRLTYTAAGAAAGTTTAVVTSISSTCDSIVLTATVDPTVGRDTLHTVRFLVRGYDGTAATTTLDSVSGRVLNASSYSRSTSVVQPTTSLPTVTAATSRALITGSGGSIVAASTLIGTTTIQYLPFGPGISHVIYGANTNTTSTAVATISARNASGVECAAANFPSVSIGPRSTGNLANAITQGINACYGAGTDQRVYVQLTWNNTRPTVTAIYNVNNNRVSVPVTAP
jgi:hypothetical protein